MRHALAALLAVSSLTPVAGCFSASYGDRPFTCPEPSFACPEGFHCAEGVCVRTDSSSAVDVIDGRTIEPDWRTDVPVTPDLPPGFEKHEVWSHDTETDFAKDGPSTNTLIVGTGTGAALQIDTGLKKAEKAAGAASVVDRGAPRGWGNTGPGVLASADGNAAKSDGNTTSPYETDWLIAQSFKLSPPAFASAVTGVQVLYRRRAECANPQNGRGWVNGYMDLKKPNGSFYGNRMPGSYYWAVGWEDVVTGGDTDRWGTSLSWADITPDAFGIAMRCTNIQGKVSGAYHSAYIDRVIVRVFYRGTEGTITTELIPKDAQADAWESVEASQNVPAQTSLVYDVLDGADGDKVLLPDQTPPFSLSGVPHHNLKLRLRMKTSTTATPAVDWIKVYSRRPRGTKGDGKVAGDSGAPDMPEN